MPDAHKSIMITDELERGALAFYGIEIQKILEPTLLAFASLAGVRRSAAVR